MKLIQTNIDDVKFDWTAEKIVVDTYTKLNLLELSQKYSEMRKIYLALLDHDFILYMHSGTKSYFIKRNQVATIWQRKDLHQQGELFYTVSDVPREQINKLAPLRLLVVFSSLPADKTRFSPNIAKRMMPADFQNIKQHILKNTIVVRIMDLNRSTGSFYMNTTQYPNFERDVQQVINKIQKQYMIQKDDIIFWGWGKGATAALYYALQADSNAVTVDPVLRIDQDVEDNQYDSFLKNVLPNDLTGKLQALTRGKQYHYQQLIFAVPLLSRQYPFYKSLTGDNIHIRNLFYGNCKTKEDVRRFSMAEQATTINDYFLNSETYQSMVKHATSLLE